MPHDGPKKKRKKLTKRARPAISASRRGSSNRQAALAKLRQELATAQRQGNTAEVASARRRIRRVMQGV